jgi:hypothetical protein
MQNISNPPGQTAVPDGSGGIKFVPHAASPQGQPWGHYRYTDANGALQVARGPRPSPGAGAYDWHPDGGGSAPAAGGATMTVPPSSPPSQPTPPPVPQVASLQAGWEASIQRVCGSMRGATEERRP